MTQNTDPAGAYLAEARRNWDAFGDGVATPSLLAASEVALELHQPAEGRPGVCAEDGQEIPCRTVKAITVALLGGVSGGA